MWPFPFEFELEGFEAGSFSTQTLNPMTQSNFRYGQRHSNPLAWPWIWSRKGSYTIPLWSTMISKAVFSASLAWPQMKVIGCFSLDCSPVEDYFKKSHVRLTSFPEKYLLITRARKAFDKGDRTCQNLLSRGHKWPNRGILVIKHKSTWSFM